MTPVALTEIEFPDVVLELDPEHTADPTVHCRLCPAEQVTGVEHDPLVDTVPLVQYEVAEPIVGAVESVTGELVPLAPPGYVALQVFPPDDQDTVCDPHAAGAALHDAPACTEKDPLLHVNVAFPVVPLTSETEVEFPLFVAAAVPSQKLPPTDHETAWAVQLAGGAALQVEPACRENVPFEHE